MTRVGTGVAGLAVIAAVSGALVTGGSGSDTPAPATAGPVVTPADAPTTANTKASEPGIQLIAYSGEQVPGYKVGFVPKGWEIQGGSNTTLTIAPKGFKNQDINQWVGKLVVQLQSKDASEEVTPITEEDLKAWGMEGENLTTTVSKVTVNGRKASLTLPVKPDGTTSVSVTFPDGKGHTVVIQGPSTLEWNDAQWIRFAEGVKVLRNAEAGVG